MRTKELFELSQEDVIVRNAFMSFYPAFIRDIRHDRAIDPSCCIDKDKYISALEQIVLTMSPIKDELLADLRRVLENGGAKIEIHVKDTELESGLREKYYQEYLSRKWR